MEEANSNPEVNEFQREVIPETQIKYVLVEKKRKSYSGWLLTLSVLLTLILPFHYIPSRGMILTKENLSFRFTIITEHEIGKLIDRFNNASISEKSAINSEPVVRVLMAKGILEESKSKSDLLNY